MKNLAYIGFGKKFKNFCYFDEDGPTRGISSGEQQILNKPAKREPMTKEQEDGIRERYIKDKEKEKLRKDADAKESLRKSAATKDLMDRFNASRDAEVTAAEAELVVDLAAEGKAKPISAKTDMEELKTTIPELFKEGEMIAEEGQNATYGLIARKGDVVSVEFNNMGKGPDDIVVDGVDFIKDGKLVQKERPIENGEIVSSLKYVDADYVLNRLEDYDLLTPEERQQLTTLSKNYPDRESRDFYFYESVAATIERGWDIPKQGNVAEISVLRYKTMLEDGDKVNDISDYLNYDEMKSIPHDSPIRSDGVFKMIAKKEGLVGIDSFDEFLKKIHGLIVAEKEG